MKNIKNKVLKETKDIVEKFGPRLAGTKAALDTADYLYDEALKYSDSTYKQDFYINKGAFLGWIKIIVILYVIGLIAFSFKYPIITLSLSLFSLITLYFQFIRYFKFIDFLYPKKLARNVYGIIEPKLEVKRQVIISGHHDSAPIFNFFIYQPKLYGLRVTGSILFVILSLILGLLNFFIKNNILFYVSLGVLGIGLLLVLQLYFFRSKKGTPGAGDNLASTMVAFKLGEYFYNLKGTESELKHTRVIFASFDAEEEGLRGARAFVKENKTTLESVDTTLLNIECLYDASELFFLTSDINNSVKLSNSLVDELITIGLNNNIKLKKQDIAMLTGGTDAGEFAKTNVKATTIMGMPWSNDNRNTAYHTPNDTIDSVSDKAVLDTLILYCEYIKLNDFKI